MKLESNYIRTEALGAATCGGAPKADFVWRNGKCIHKPTDKAYSGDQKDSACQCLFGDAPTRTGEVFNFLKKSFFGGTISEGRTVQQASITTSSLLVPAVAVVGGVALLLILKKKK